MHLLPFLLQFSSRQAAQLRHRAPWTRAALLSALALISTVGVTGLSGCVYRIDIQQGNFLDPKDVDRVTVGMTRLQVRALLGTPMVADPFESWRWDYVYYLKKGRWQEPLQRHFIVHFEDDKVTRIDRSDQAAAPVRSSQLTQSPATLPAE